MNISKDTVVQLHYTLKDEDGQQIESTAGHDPIAYLQGHKNMIPGFEEAVESKQAGDKLDITVTPENGYGHRVEGSVQRVPVKHLRGASKWKKGMVASVFTEQGERQVTIVKVGRFMADVDTNHPFAGKTLHFNVEILGVRAATAEELEHGHAHGVGGHQH
ncbi:peptidylprolyl isomerase [Thalassolituus sp.]|uniref:FKBP-type peptidyl-prolyl cis-trans isomerase n=1 Tax=Thalassolituus sp. TaxID=2030822 RepID=UPI00351581C0